MTVSNETWRRLVRREAERLIVGGGKVLRCFFNKIQANALIIEIRFRDHKGSYWFALNVDELDACRRNWKDDVRAGFNSAKAEMADSRRV